MSTPTERPRSALTYLLCGMAMGAADVVPGVSGGTIAFITGIYQNLLNAIKAFDLTFARLLLTGKLREALSRIPWGFLLPLVCGIGLSILTLARVVLYLLAHHPVAIWSFFFGLVLASVFLLRKDLGRLGPGEALSLLAGLAFAWWLGGAPQLAQSSASMPVIFASAFVAICAMILPGISGAFILVLLGKYQMILTAVITLDLPVLGVFALGCITGLLSFARLLSYTLNRFPSLTVACLLGLMLGSLRKVWPWQTDGALAAPGEHLGLALLCCALGLALPLLLQMLARRLHR